MILGAKKLKLSFFFFIIIALVLYVYYITQNKGYISVNKNELRLNEENIEIEKGITKFTDVEYKTSDERKREYVTRGKQAYINKNDTNLIYLTNVYSFTTLNDGSILNVKSDKANFYKNSKNIKYYQNVIINNKDRQITAGEAYFFSNQNQIKLENNVIFKDNHNTIKSDIAELNTNTNDLKIFMNRKTKKVYGRREQK